MKNLFKIKHDEKIYKIRLLPSDILFNSWPSGLYSGWFFRIDFVLFDHRNSTIDKLFYSFFSFHKKDPFLLHVRNSYYTGMGFCCIGYHFQNGKYHYRNTFNDYDDGLFLQSDPCSFIC